jgi:hypothetical protein
MPPAGIRQFAVAAFSQQNNQYQINNLKTV